MSEFMVLGRRFSLGPVLGQDPIQFAFARKSFKPADPMAVNATREKALASGGGGRPAGPVGEEAVVPPTQAEPLAADPGVVAKASRAPVASDVYTRAAASGSYSPRVKHTHRELTAQEEAAIDNVVAAHKKNPRAAHLDPLAVALHVGDVPVHRVAHRIEATHGIPTVPQGAGGASPTEYGGDYDSWLAARAASASPGLTSQEEDEARQIEEAEERRRAEGAEKLAGYAKAGVITPESARKGATHLSLDAATTLSPVQDGLVMPRSLRYWLDLEPEVVN